MASDKSIVVKGQVYYVGDQVTAKTSGIDSKTVTGNLCHIDGKRVSVSEEPDGYGWPNTVNINTLKHVGDSGKEARRRAEKVKQAEIHLQGLRDLLDNTTGKTREDIVDLIKQEYGQSYEPKT